jgi:hypothetical protein
MVRGLDFTWPSAFYFHRRDHPCFLTFLSKLFNSDDEMAKGAWRKRSILLSRKFRIWASYNSRICEQKNILCENGQKSTFSEVADCQQLPISLHPLVDKEHCF